jgi:hypothetical protein
VGDRWLPATAHATRLGRRGQEVLICHESRLIWVSAQRVRPLHESGSTREDPPAKARKVPPGKAHKVPPAKG